MAEGAPLLREYGVKSSIEGSNPSVSSNGFALRRSPGIQNERPRSAGPFSWPDRVWLQRYTPSHAPGCTDALSPSALAVGRFSVNMLSGVTTEKSM